MKTFRCLYRHQDHGCLHSSTIAAIDDYYACGSGSGVVNLYETQLYNFLFGKSRRGYVVRFYHIN